MERIVNSYDPTIIKYYPNYLQGFLQRSYIFLKNIIPQGMSTYQQELSNSVKDKFLKLTEADFEDDGAFSISTLESRLKLL